MIFCVGWWLLEDLGIRRKCVRITKKYLLVDLWGTVEMRRSARA
jgi:hypothetical protein